MNIRYLIWMMQSSCLEYAFYLSFLLPVTELPLELLQWETISGLSAESSLVGSGISSFLLPSGLLIHSQVLKESSFVSLARGTCHDPFSDS